MQAGVEVLIRLQRAISALYIAGSRFKVAWKVKRNLNIRRAFTVNQLIEILLDSHEEVIFVEHDALLVMLLRQLGRDRTIFYLSCCRDRVFELITKMADRYVYVEREANGYYISDVSYDGVRQLFCPKNAQLTLEAF
ncbi:MAG: hypothetical protein HA489_00805 [Archaeoglobales archaeon]|nr:hypothetical protein [Archaeoglobales archaeon]